MTHNTLSDKLYFVNIPIEGGEVLTKLKPLIPHNILFGEDINTPRVCLSSSIWGCIDAIGRQRIVDILDEYATEIVGVPFHIYEVQTNLLDKEVLITPLELFLTNRVQDAWITQEYWYLDEIELDFPTIIEVGGIDWESFGIFSISKPLIDRYLSENGIQQNEFNEDIYSDIINAVYDGTLKDPRFEYPIEIYPAIEIYLIDGSSIKREDINHLYRAPPIQEPYLTDSTIPHTDIKSLSF